MRDSESRLKTGATMARMWRPPTLWKYPNEFGLPRGCRQVHGPSPSVEERRNLPSDRCGSAPTSTNRDHRGRDSCAAVSHSWANQPSRAGGEFSEDRGPVGGYQWGTCAAASVCGDCRDPSFGGAYECCRNFVGGRNAWPRRGACRGACATCARARSRLNARSLRTRSRSKPWTRGGASWIPSGTGVTTRPARRSTGRRIRTCLTSVGRTRHLNRSVLASNCTTRAALLVCLMRTGSPT